jgi:hypothetical protein
MLANFLGVLPILTPPLCALAFIMCSKSNTIVVFALDLMSTYEGEHMIFGLLGQANPTQNDVPVFSLISLKVFALRLALSHVPFKASVLRLANKQQQPCLKTALA